MVSIVVLVMIGCSSPGISGPASGVRGPTSVSEQAEAAAETGPGEGAGDEDALPAGQGTSTVPAENKPDQPKPTLTAAPDPVVDLNSSDLAVPVYAAAIHRVYNIDSSFGDGPEFPLVYLISTTDDGAGLDVPLTAPQTLSADLQQALTAALADQPFEIIWVPRVDDVPLDGQGRIADGEGIYIILGNILPQADGRVHLPFFMVCGPLCLTGKVYVLSEVEGTWQVTGDTGLVIQG
jgi:hypothetical protein